MPGSIAIVATVHSAFAAGIVEELGFSGAHRVKIITFLSTRSLQKMPTILLAAATALSMAANPGVPDCTENFYDQTIDHFNWGSVVDNPPR